MDRKLEGYRLAGRIKAVQSKSYAHRMLMASALTYIQGIQEDDRLHIGADVTHSGTKQKNTVWTTGFLSDVSGEDIHATKSCLKEFIEYILNSDKDSIGDRCLNEYIQVCCGESASTLRFLLAVAGGLGLKVCFSMKGRLSERPLSLLGEELERMGCSLTRSINSSIYIRGQLHSGDYYMDGGVSSQFISGLLFALPLLTGDSRLHVTKSFKSKPYVDMTMEVLRKSGIVIEQLHPEEENVCQTYNIPGGQHYNLNMDGQNIEGDWSNASFWLAAAAMGGTEIVCEGISLNSLQGDRCIADILRQFGADVELGDSYCRVCGTGRLHGTDIDASDIPDLVPVISVVAAASQGTTVIDNVGRLRTKESNRLDAVSDMLTVFGADIEVEDNRLRITGRKQLRGGQINSYNDHRIVMAAAVASVVSDSPVIISHAEAVNKSYPDFFKDFERLNTSY